ncbi:MAG: hypothetical protein ABIB98_03355 [bacterium]
METVSALKSVILAIFCFLSLFLLGYVFKTFSLTSLDLLLTQPKKGIEMGLLFLLAIFLIIITYSTISFVIEGKLKLAIFFIVGFLAYILGFSTPPFLPNQIIIACVSAFFISLGLLKMCVYIKMGYLNSIKPKISLLIPKNIHGFLVILGIVLSLNFYIFFTESTKGQALKIPENLLNKVMEPVIKIIENNLETQINNQLQNSLGQVIDTQDREEMLKFIQAELEETFSEGSTRQQLGFNQDVINPKDITLTSDGNLDIAPVLENLKPTLVKQVNKVLEPYAKYIPILLAFSLFFILESLFSFLPFLITPFIFITIRLLKNVKFIKLIKSTVEVERYSL